MRTRSVKWTCPAEKDLRRLERSTQERIRKAVYRLVETGTGDVRKLEGVEEQWRLRVGDWRVRFTLSDEGEVIILLVLRVLPRGGAYQE